MPGSTVMIIPGARREARGGVGRMRRWGGGNDASLREEEGG